MKTKILSLLLCAISWEIMAQQPFVNNAGVVQPDPAVVNIAFDDFVFGSTTLDAGFPLTFKRFFFDKGQGAFRAGTASVGFWDAPQIGQYSFAVGVNTIASGESSFAAGEFSRATGYTAVAFGPSAEASGGRSFALGQWALASAEYSYALGNQAQATNVSAIAIGQQARATNQFSVALGFNVTSSGYGSVALGRSVANSDYSLSGGTANATGEFSTALGSGQTNGTGAFAAGVNTQANGQGAAALGDNTIATGFGSTAFGQATNALNDGAFVAGNQLTANGQTSSAFGLGNIADYNNETVVGLFNDQNAYGGAFSRPLFVVGNGDNANLRDNALAVLKNGDVVIPDLPADLSLNPAQAMNVVVDSDGKLRVAALPGGVSTDNQTLSFNPSTLDLTISNGNTVTLVDTDTDQQSLNFNNSTNQLTISNGNTVVIPDEDQQTLSFNPTTNQLTISNGNSVLIPSAGGGTTYQAGAGISIQGNTINTKVINGLRVESSDNTVRLGGPLVENTYVNMKGYTMAFDGEGDFVVGDYNVDQTQGGLNSKMFFETQSGSFRAGVVMGTEWDQPNLGGASFAFGQQTEAPGNFSFAGGIKTAARDDYAMAFGYLSEANKSGSVALGYYNKANGGAATALGNSNNSTGDMTFTVGNGNNANGLASVAVGNLNTSNGDFSQALGLSNTSIGRASVALGDGNVSYGDASVALASGNITYGIKSIAGGAASITHGTGSIALGFEAKAFSRGEIAMGATNTTYTPSGGAVSWDWTDRLFVLGRGSINTNPQDAFTVFKNGNAILAGNLSQSSDKRLKSNIKSIDRASDKLSQLDGYTYTWTKEANRAEGMQYGVIAQEVKEVFPELVTVDGEGYYSVNYSGLIPVLISAYKEEKVRMDSEIADLRAQIEELRGMIPGAKGNGTGKSAAAREAGSSDIAISPEVFLYPNPAGDKVVISGISGTFDYEVMSTDGKVLLQKKAHQGEIDLGDLSKGLFLVRVIHDSTTYQMKVILE